MTYKLASIIIVLLSVLSIKAKSHTIKTNKHNISAYSEKSLELISTDIARKLYYNIDSNNFKMPSEDSFVEAVKAYYALKDRGILKKNILTVVDFSLPSTEKRLWVIDLNNNKVLYHTLVSHGKNSGEVMANDFSNENNSYKSSLGVYLTEEIYNGKHGVSLRINGMEKGKNDNARKRSVVIHGADYVSESYVKTNKSLGRSLGCPAIPMNLSDAIISIIKNKSCLYIHHPSNKVNLDLLTS